MKKSVKKYVVLRDAAFSQSAGSRWVPVSNEGKMVFKPEDIAISSKEAARAIKDQCEAAGHRAKIKRW